MGIAADFVLIVVAGLAGAIVARSLGLPLLVGYVVAGVGGGPGRAPGMPTTDAIWFGAMVSLSSTMVVLKTLAADGTTSTLASRVMIGLLVVQDLAVVPMLFVLPHAGDASGAVPQLAQASLVAAAFLLAMVLIGTRLLPAMLRR